MQQLWDIIVVGIFKKGIVRKLNGLIRIQKNVRANSHFLNGEAYILATTKMDGANELLTVSKNLVTKMKQVLYCVGKQKINNDITPQSAIVYASRVIIRVN